MLGAAVNDNGPPLSDDGRRFQTEGRGIVRSAASTFYIPRLADDELFMHLRRGQPCHVLAPRQIGKSSLRVRTMERLAATGVHVASVDLTAIGTDTSPSEWYYSLAATIVDGLELAVDLDAEWRKRNHRSPVRRFREVLSDVVLAALSGPVVVFIDEIDVTMRLPFSRDDFFGVLREMHQARASEPRWERLTFCLTGVATPLDLVKDAERTPFNTSLGISLSDFTEQETSALLPGLVRAGPRPRELLRAIYAWTGGHPALTQRLCYWLTERYRENATRRQPAARVEALVRSLFLRRGRIDDPILHDVEKRFDDDRPDARVPVMLHLYKRLLAGEKLPVDGNNARQLGLRIAGLAAERGDASGTWLVVRNRIVREVFGESWVDHKLGRRLLTEPLELWRESGKRDEHVLRGQALALALQWSIGKDDVTPDERDYLAASQAVALQEQHLERRAEVERALREKAVIQRRAWSVVATILSVLVVVLWFLYQNANARQLAQAELATRARTDKRLTEQKLGEATRLAEDVLAQSKLEADRKAELYTQANAEAARARAEAERAARELAEAQKLVTVGWSFRDKATRLEAEHAEKTKEAQDAAQRARRAEEEARGAKSREEQARASLEIRARESDAATATLTASLAAFQEEAERAQRNQERKIADLEATLVAVTSERDVAVRSADGGERKVAGLTEENTRLRNEIAALRQRERTTAR
jgi:hypothetical protein